MALVVDLAASNRAVTDDEFRAWAEARTVFLSSVMGELAEERRVVARALDAAGCRVRWFEEFGGRDDSPEEAYLSEVAGADLYVGLLGDEYGTMQPTGYSATHAEYLEARKRGRRVSFWARRDDSARAGHARDFLNEVHVFQVAGSFDGPSDLAEKLLRRLREMAAEDLAPWVKFGDVVFRAERITDSGTEVRIRSRVRDEAVLRALEALAPQAGFGRPNEVAVTYGDRSGRGRAEGLRVETTSQAFRDIELTVSVDWTTGGDPMAVATSGYSADDLTEVGIRAGLLGEALPDRLTGTGGLGLGIDTSDPLDELQRLQVREGSIQPIARLLVVEALVGRRKASAVERFAIGPVVQGTRRVGLNWREPKHYSNFEPGTRSIEGARRWG